MPDLAAEMFDLSARTYFASTDFVLTYWQLTLDPLSYDPCEVITSQRVVVSKTVV